MSFSSHNLLPKVGRIFLLPMHFSRPSVSFSLLRPCARLLSCVLSGQPLENSQHLMSPREPRV
jgi:hypothetical protein